MKYININLVISIKLWQPVVSGQTAKVELFPFIATRSQLQRSQVIREPHEMLLLVCTGGGRRRGNHWRPVYICNGLNKL